MPKMYVCCLKLEYMQFVFVKVVTPIIWKAVAQITENERVSTLLFLFIGTIILLDFLLGRESSIAFPKKELKVKIGFHG